MTIHDTTLADGPALVDASVAGLGALLGDRFVPSDISIGQRAVRPTASDTIALVDTAAFSLGVQVFERLIAAELYEPGTHYHLTQAEVIGIRAAISVAREAVLGETVNLVDAAAVVLSLRLIDSLGIADALLPSFLYTRTVDERIRLIDSLARFFGAEAEDTIEIADEAVGPAYKVGLVEETLGIAGALTPLLLLRVTAQDRVTVSDADLVQMVFSGWLSDGVDVHAGFLLPGTAFTTWAMNTRTAAVTEYRNFAFNSFGRIGNKYLAASDDGLYELLGDTDDGEDIIATIRSGFAQWAGAHLHSFKAAYLAVRGEGVFVLRLITADGKVYNYTVTQETMRTTKVHMGKGLRARYFAFELVSAGQDFDFETLEFIPLVANRRV